MSPTRTHDLVALLALSAEVAPSLADFEADCAELTIRAIRSRYPDDREEVTEDDARSLVAKARRIREALLHLLA